VYGRLSDRIGRRPLLLFFGIAGTLLSVPLLTLLQNTRSPIGAFLIMMAALLIVSGYTSINAIREGRAVPTKIRALGVGLPYALTVAIFGGTAELIALALKQAGHESVFFYYVSGCILVSLVVYVTMRRPRELAAGERSGVGRELLGRRAGVRGRAVPDPGGDQAEQQQHRGQRRAGAERAADHRALGERRRAETAGRAGISCSGGTSRDTGAGAGAGPGDRRVAGRRGTRVQSARSRIVGRAAGSSRGTASTSRAADRAARSGSVLR